MKLKHRPEDFQVDEQLADVPRGGPLGLYRLTKRGLGTPEAIRAVCEHWRLRRDDVSYCGLKDRHAQTTQWVAIHGGPRRNLHESNLELVFVDTVARPLQSTDIAANRFRITLRDLQPEQVQAMADQLEFIGRDGLPNYFDRQRFGSLGESGEFMAQAWCERRHERTLWLALADPMAADRPADRTEKQLLRDRWGQWEWLAAKLPRSPRRDAAAWLAGHPDDFRRAVVAIPAAQRRLHIEAFQSHLWNRLLAALLQEVCPSEQLLNRAVASQTMPFYRALDDAQRSRLAAARLPLPSSRTRLEAGPMAVLVESTLASMNLRLRDLEIRYPRDSFFSKGDRAATFLPQQLAHQADDDDLYPGRRKLLLQFDLPRGCYATILIGRLTE